MNQALAPLFEALISWQQKKPISFHVPGHKNGIVFPTQAAEHFESILKMDATELRGLDDLHEPQSVIRHAQQLTARFYGAEESYFLVGGSTVGNLAMIMAACHEGDTVLVQRNSHKSVMNGLELANVCPVFLTPVTDEKTKTAVSVSLETVMQAYAAFPNAKAIILTHPNYYGISANNLKEIVAFAKEKKMLVLVDEAHGAHFGISSDFPSSALSFGADIVVQSAHKSLPAMTMGSWLHINTGFSKREKLKKWLSLFQSSSPSYPIMASLDLARWYLANFSIDDINQLIQRIQSFQKKLETIPEIRVVKPSPHFKQDPLKLIIQSTTGLSGFELQKQLEEKGIFTELADQRNVLFVLPLSVYPYEETVLKRMREAMMNVPKKHLQQRFEWVNDKVYEPYSTLALSYKQMLQQQVNETRLDDAEGKIAAESIIPYPPGIPLLIPGEVISKKHLFSIRKLMIAGGMFQGGKRLKDGYVRVFAGS